MKVNKTKLFLGTTGVGFTATGWGLYAAQPRDKSEEFKLEIEQLQNDVDSRTEQLQQEHVINSKINGNLHYAVETFSKDPTIVNTLVEQKDEILKLKEENEKLKRHVNGYEDLILEMENKTPEWVGKELDTAWTSYPKTQELKAVSDTLTREISDVWNEKSELDQKVKGLLEGQELSSEVIKELEEKLEKVTEENDKLKRYVNGYEDLILEIENKTRDWVGKELSSETVKDLLQKLKDKDVIVDNLESKLAEVTNNFSEYISQVNWMNQTTDSMIEYKNGMIEYLKKEINQKESEIQTYTNNILGLQLKVKELEAKNKGLDVLNKGLVTVMERMCSSKPK